MTNEFEAALIESRNFTLEAQQEIDDLLEKQAGLMQDKAHLVEAVETLLLNFQAYLNDRTPMREKILENTIIGIRKAIR